MPKDKRSVQAHTKLKLQIPAAAGNLGPGFDTLGLALALYCRITFEPLDEPNPGAALVTYSGRMATSSPPRHTDSLTYKLLSELWRDDHKLAQRVRIRIDSDIPLGSGLGGRTSAILGALWAHSIFNDRVPVTSDLLARMAELEGHTETFAAALMGNFVISARVGSQNRVITHQLDWPTDWATIVVIPERRLSTSHARAVLPKTLPLHETIYNLQRTALLVSSVVSVDESALKEALQDRVHEPFRHELVPELASLRQFLHGSEALGCVLCGGGPSLLVVVNRKHKDALMQRISEWALKQPSTSPPQVMDIGVDRQGIRELH